MVHWIKGFPRNRVRFLRGTLRLPSLAGTIAKTELFKIMQALYNPFYVGVFLGWPGRKRKTVLEAPTVGEFSGRVKIGRGIETWIIRSCLDAVLEEVDAQALGIFVQYLRVKRHSIAG